MWTCYIIFCSYEWRHLLDHGLGRNKSGHTMIHWKQHVWLPMPGVAAHSWWHTGYHKNVRIFEVFVKCPTCRSESWGCWCSIEGCASLDPEHCHFNLDYQFWSTWPCWAERAKVLVITTYKLFNPLFNDVSQGEMTNQKQQNWRNLWACKIWTA